MQSSASFQGAIGLTRMLPLLDVLGSCVRSAVEAVIEDCLAGRRVSDGVLIMLDDYREAAGELVDLHRPEVYKSRIVSVAVLGRHGEGVDQVVVHEAARRCPRVSACAAAGGVAQT